MEAGLTIPSGSAHGQVMVELAFFFIFIFYRGDPITYIEGTHTSIPMGT